MNGQSTFEFGGAGTGQTGGTISGTVVLLNSTLKTFGTNGIGSFRVDQSSTQTGIIGPNTAVIVEGNGGAGDVALTTDLNSTNAGSITLDSRDGGACNSASTSALQTPARSPTPAPSNLAWAPADPAPSMAASPTPARSPMPRPPSSAAGTTPTPAPLTTPPGPSPSKAVPISRCAPAR